MRVGFVGLGSQGAAMARMIERAGFELSLWARRAQTLEPFQDTGAVAVASLAELGARSEIVGVCVGDDADVDSVVLAESDGVLAGMQPGGVITVHSTVHPDTCRRLSERTRAQGVELLDAPVSGGGAVALQRKLAVMVGGEREIYERCLPIFQSYGDPVRHLGGLGAGQLCKILNNLLFTATLELSHQTVLRARALGLDAEAMREVLMRSSAQSTALSVSNLLEARQTARALGNLVKDHSLFRELARAADIDPGDLERVAGRAAVTIGSMLDES